MDRMTSSVRLSTLLGELVWDQHDVRCNSARTRLLNFNTNYAAWLPLDCTCSTVADNMAGSPSLEDMACATNVGALTYANEFIFLFVYGHTTACLTLLIIFVLCLSQGIC